MSLLWMHVGLRNLRYGILNHGSTRNVELYKSDGRTSVSDLTCRVTKAQIKELGRSSFMDRI